MLKSIIIRPFQCPCGGIGIHGRLRACALIGMLVRVQSGASLPSFIAPTKYGRDSEIARTEYAFILLMRSILVRMPQRWVYQLQ